MNIELITKEEFNALKEQIEEIRIILIQFDLPKEDKWLTSEEVCQRLKMSSRTLQNYRDKGLLKFYQNGPGSHVRYKTSDVDNFLASRSDD